jgi:hypothetical protein
MLTPSSSAYCPASHCMHDRPGRSTLAPKRIALQTAVNNQRHGIQDQTTHQENLVPFFPLLHACGLAPPARTVRTHMRAQLTCSQTPPVATQTGLQSSTHRQHYTRCLFTDIPRWHGVFFFFRPQTDLLRVSRSHCRTPNDSTRPVFSCSLSAVFSFRHRQDNVTV